MKQAARGCATSGVGAGMAPHLGAAPRLLHLAQRATTSAATTSNSSSTALAGVPVGSHWPRPSSVCGRVSTQRAAPGRGPGGGSGGACAAMEAQGRAAGAGGRLRVEGLRLWGAGHGGGRGGVQHQHHRVPRDHDRPSYKGQFVCFTHPHIGNVGINNGEPYIHPSVSSFSVCIVGYCRGIVYANDLCQLFSFWQTISCCQLFSLTAYYRTVLFVVSTKRNRNTLCSRLSSLLHENWIYELRTVC